ncbi:hypothetical protein FGSG_12334 [Fusarium graminearum PH-1]|uniref:Chromosome 2, complete genome n=1 Tax=Gibberella zeae (strain ATCC MYA-4620 / CBS 123657 / FGSC 9075 / NRRL 31084 / PH-1) TaxID=229533 RepID=I1S663_GIBZE|nr:hypothetical protein FGSG_12334 [Fusarium graminearum PH-1]ESU09172.1 hypothetical protein FGSG_12334 [Fusarium graminearum PH-1]CEF78898.1 unnamed protein product [Fusarium graminearum]|eukprot:XP_011321671.1 hypothetical protein FGSG_12334 [Fusarium graminearum PH-1]
MHTGSYILIPGYNVNPQFSLAMRMDLPCSRMHLAFEAGPIPPRNKSSISRKGAPNGICAPATHVTAVIFPITTLFRTIHGSLNRLFVLASRYCFVLSCLTYRFYEI